MNSKTVRCLYGRCGVMGNPKARKPETKNQNPESETGIRNRNRKPESRIRNPESGIHKSKKTSSSSFRKLLSKAFVGKI